MLPFTNRSHFFQFIWPTYQDARDGIVWVGAVSLICIVVLVPATVPFTAAEADDLRFEGLARADRCCLGLVVVISIVTEVDDRCFLGLGRESPGPDDLVIDDLFLVVA